MPVPGAARVPDKRKRKCEVPQGRLVSGSSIAKTRFLTGFILVDLADPGAPKFLPWVPQYIAAHLARREDQRECK